MQGLIDEYLIYAAPLLLGQGRKLLDLPMLQNLSEGIALEFIDVEKVGPDLRLLLRPAG